MQAFPLRLSPPFSGGVLCSGRVPVLVVCPVFLNHTRIHAHIHTRAHVRARGFLDHSGIFRRQFLDIIAIFGVQTAIFRLQKHKFSIKK